MKAIFTLLENIPVVMRLRQLASGLLMELEAITKLETDRGGLVAIWFPLPGMTDLRLPFRGHTAFDVVAKAKVERNEIVFEAIADPHAMKFLVEEECCALPSDAWGKVTGHEETLVVLRKALAKVLSAEDQELQEMIWHRGTMICCGAPRRSPGDANADVSCYNCGSV